ncbi:MAG: diguanylate cyclase [Ignavibacteriae bacterium]|nr:diguanylate cyclase [Ignavibacteriota bacterium]
MTDGGWIREFPAAITVCDAQGTILVMNEKACSTFADDGGEKLIGTNVRDCHPEPARTKLAALFESEQLNVYTIEKGGVKKLIYQSPWYENGKYAGIVELSLPIPEHVPHFVRDAKPVTATGAAIEP